MKQCSTGVTRRYCLPIADENDTIVQRVFAHNKKGAFWRACSPPSLPHCKAVFLYDRRGSGESTGTFETADFSLLAADARAAIAVLATRSDIDAQRIGLYGVSQGGWIAPLVAAQYPTVALLVIVSGCGVTPAEQMI